jgi:dipeptidyl-peptidase-4
LQNKAEVTTVNPFTGASSVLYTEENDRFISEIDDQFIHFTSDGKYFIVKSEQSGNFHFYLYNLDGRLVNPVTRGHWDVKKLLGIDEKKGILYFTSNKESEIQQHIYAVNLNGKNMQRLSEKPGTHDAEFSSNFKYFIDTWSDANYPFTYSLCRNDGTLLRIMEDNSSLKKAMDEYGFSRKEFMRIPVSDSLELNAYLIKPANFDSTKKYPLFMSVYGGPESQDVADSWDNGLAWQQLLTQHGIVIACVDNRGTNGRGEAFRKSTYLQLGKLETEDQMNAAMYLGNMRWIDRSRIGIWGWSYGGYMTLLCLTRGADVFSMGIAVAPVTNWRFYDNIYTERYMRKPQDNAKGYDDNSPINYAGLLKGKLLIVHGTADDNVHLQNSIEMSECLIRENKQFQQFYYPNRNHSIYGGNTRMHLYTMMTNYILKEL